MYLIRYGELALKSKKVRQRFEDILILNIKNALEKHGKNARIKNIYGRFLAESEKNLDEELKKVFGIVSFSPCFKSPSDLAEIKKMSLHIANLKKVETFAIRCNRTGEHSYSSKDVEKEVGALIVEKFGNRVDLTKPDKTIWIDVRNKEAYFYTEIIEGPGGLPIGTAGKVFCFVENFNDAAAAWLFMKRGCEVVFSGKYPEDLEKWNSGKKLIFENGHIEDILEKQKFLAIVRGEVEIKKWQDEFPLPIFRPLIGFGEKELDELGKKIRAN